MQSNPSRACPAWGHDGTHAHKLYELLENGRYPFRGLAPVPCPGVTLLAATTDAGALHPALQRRWIRHQFQPLDAEHIARGLRLRPFLITRAAADEIARLTAPGGVMWEAVELHRLAEWRARAEGEVEITLIHVDWVCEQQQIDEHGLRALDRRVVEALLKQPRLVRGGAVVYGASERDTALLAQIDPEEYRQSIRPRLLARGLLTIQPGVGQVLTPLALILGTTGGPSTPVCETGDGRP